MEPQTIAGIVSGALAVDSIIVPFLTDGKTTLHEYLKLPPKTDTKIWGERTILMSERALCGALTLAYYSPEIYNSLSTLVQYIK